MNKWQTAVSDNGFNGNIRVKIQQEDFQGSTIEISAYDLDGETLFSEHSHTPCTAEAIKELVQSLIEHIIWGH